MSELKPVDGELSPEARALVEALRSLFAGLGISTRRYAARRSYDSSTVSRYLSGRRLPPWEFVLNLMHDVAEKRGTTPTQDTVAMLRSLHAAAVRSSNSPVSKVQLLERKLAEADDEARRAATRERWLEETLRDREHRVRDLELHYLALQAMTGGMPSHGMDEPTPSEAPPEEHARLHDEIRRLQDELARVRALHRDAEERCNQLERLLAEAEGQERRSGGSDLLPAAIPFTGLKAEPLPHSAAPTSTSYHFGEVHGTINVFTDLWRVDESFIAAVTVRIRQGDAHLGNGLLLDPHSVLTAGVLLKRSTEFGEPGQPIEVVVGEQVIRAVPSATVDLPEIGSEVTNSVVTLRLAEAAPFPERPLSFDWRLIPGRQLLVGAQATSGPYSCLLDVTGRTGDWLRVTGEIVGGLAGAPAFSSSGEVAGLVFATYQSSRNRGLVVPAATLRTSGALS
ncbi:hypothetical protein ACWFQ8_05600 [Streptomyces sp. NPDC055254]